MTKRHRPATISMFFMLIALLLVASMGAATAHAVPGEISADGPQFRIRSAEKQVDDLSAADLGRVIARLDDGSYLAFGDTAKVRRLSKNTLLYYERRVLRIRHFSRRGKLDRKFDKSPIGRGVTLGRAYELWDFMGIVRQSPSVYVAWGTHDDRGTGTPSMKSVAFSARTGRLIRTFGTNGVQRFGRIRGLTEGGFVETNAMQPLADGRVLSCGAMRLPKMFAVDSRSRALLNVTDLTHRSPVPFLASGSRAFGAGETPEDGAFRDCRAIAQSTSGRIVIAGEQGTDYYLNNPRPWLAAFDPSGSPDTSFGVNGTAVLPESFGSAAGGELVVRSLNADRNGGVYVAGRIHGGANRGFVARLDASGVLDSSFGTGGLVVVPKFTVNDISEGDDGGLLLTGTTGGAGGAAAAGRLTPRGAWDPNFCGTGQRAYPLTFTLNFFQLFAGPTAYLWESTDGNVREILRIENQVTLDSSIATLRKRSGRSVSISGFASSPTGLARVEVAIAPAGSAPSAWTAASGTHLWSASVALPRTRKKLVIYSRAIGLDGATESEFSTADKNRLVVR